MRTAAIVIQSYFRGWVAREELKWLKYLKKATWAAGIIAKWFHGWKARKQVCISHAVHHDAAVVL